MLDAEVPDLMVAEAACTACMQVAAACGQRTAAASAAAAAVAALVLEV